MNSGYIWIDNIPILQSESGWKGQRTPCLIIPSDYVESISDTDLHVLLNEHFLLGNECSIQRDGAFVWINYQRNLQ